jgi:hypothetical protein
MKITRRQLRELIKESMYDPMYGMKSLDEPFRSKVMSVIDDPDASEEDLKQFHQLGDDFSGYEDSRPGMPDDSLAGVKRQREEFAREGAQQIEAYLPGFLDLPQEIIDAVAEFVFLSKDPTLHIELDEDLLFHQRGSEDLDRYHTDYRKNPKNYDPKYYYIFDAHGEYKGKDPISRMDPYRDPNSQYPAHREGDSQTGFHDGFREEYQKVTTEPTHKRSSNAAESAFIEMMRDLRPDHKEYVIN